MENIIVIEEKVILPETPLCEQTVTIPCIKGDKGDKGDPFTYEDFTPEQIKELQKPATDAGAVSLAAANKANAAADKANQAAESIENRFSGERTGRIYLKYNRTQQAYIMPISIWAEEDYIYLVIWGEAILCLSWNGELIWKYILWCTTGKTITVKGDYLYQFGNNNGTIYKINRYTGKTELSNKNDSVSYHEQKK